VSVLVQINYKTSLDRYLLTKEHVQKCR